MATNLTISTRAYSKIEAGETHHIINHLNERKIRASQLTPLFSSTHSGKISIFSAKW